MSDVLSPVSFEDLYNKVILAGVRSPGRVTLSGHDRKIGWDVKKATGQKGATMTRTGEDLVEFAASFYLADDEDFEAWPAFDGLLRSSVGGTTPKALDIYHPDLVINRIVSVVLVSIAGVIHDGKGGQTINVKLSEYRPPQKASGSPSGSKAKPKDPNADLLNQLNGLTAEYQNTPWGKDTRTEEQKAAGLKEQKRLLGGA